MGLYFGFQHRTNDPDLMPGWHPVGDFGFNKPSFHLDHLATPLGRPMGIADFLGVPEESRCGTDFFVPDWYGILQRGTEVMVSYLTDRIWGEGYDEGPPPEHHCGCPECLDHSLGDLVRLLMLAQFALKSSEPANYGFSWSP